ncbi:MAG: class I SAM-dependent methyltransferase [Verrucomicrobiota bacterium]
MIPAPPERYRAPLQRVVIPEILDALNPDHPDAIASRKDLERINFMMGNYRFLKNHLLRNIRPRDRCIEIGSGGGLLCSVLSERKIPHGITGLDLAPRPDHWPASWHWQQQDLFDTSSLAGFDIILASLILHHFTDEQLRKLAPQLTATARVLIFTEPLRSSFSHTLGRLAEIIGIHPVTRHDMHVSIDAGFRRGEIPALLGLSQKIWHIREWHDWRGSLRVVASRR